MDSPSHDGASSSSDSLERKPPFARLINHFVSAKKALSSTNNVWRANEIVAHAKKSIENTVTLDSKTKVLRKSIDQQFTILKSVRHGLETVQKDAQKELKEILKNLDVADARVKQAIHVLKTTQVEASLRPANERPKTLHDFVDEKGVDQLTAAFRECIDNTSDAQNDFTDSNAAFDRVIQKIGEKIHSGTKVDPSYDYPELVTLFHSSEDHATEMANLLQSLVRHYDLCYKALKHTEGGDEAAQTLQEDLPDGVAVHGSPNRPATPQPISDEEKAEMMEVLDKDAEEVQDVVNEIRDRVLEMETHHEQIVNQEKVLETDHSVLVEVISMLEVVGSSLPQYVRASATFIGRWHEIKFRIDENMQEINGLRDFFAGFYRAYDGLLIEIARRKLTKGRIEKFVKESMSKVEAMLDEDLEEREAFKSEHGEYLPSDIWPDLGQPPAGYEIRRVDESGDRIPEIPTDIVQRAVIRNRR